MQEQQPLPLPMALQPWIQINYDYHVLLCAPCRYALRPQAFNRHMRDKHQVHIKLRQQLDIFIQQWPWPYDADTVPLPPDESRAQDVLPIINGFRCCNCTYKTRHRGNARQHANKQHQQQHAPDATLFCPVQLQTWFGEKRERYWVVDAGPPAAAASPAVRVAAGSSQHGGEEEGEEEEGEGEGGNRRGSRGDQGEGGGHGGQGDVDAQIKADVAAWEAEVKERRLALAQKPPAAELDPWLRYSGWNEVLAKSKHGLVQTHAFTRMPDANEQSLVRILQAWSYIFERCLDTLAATDHKDVLKWWHSPQQNVASQHPFELPQNSKTLDKYSRQWQCFLCYVMRTCPDEEVEECETGATYSERQWRCVDEVRMLVEEEEELSNVEQERRAAVVVAGQDPNPELTTAVMALIVSIVTQDTSKISLYASPLMHFLAVCGINPTTRGFQPIFSYTPILARILWIGRLLLLEIALPLAPWPELQLCSREQHLSIIKQVHTIRKKHLCEGSFSPMSSILTQLAKGKALNKLHRSESNIYWSDDRQTVYYEGKGVAMAKITSMCQQLTSELQAILHELLFHQDVDDVPLAKVVDSMGAGQYFRQDGFSFVDHRDNTQFRVSWEFLYRRMLQDAPRWQLVKMASGSGSGSGLERKWIDVRKSAYLAREQQFLRKLMVNFHIAGGQPARGPELGSIKVVNSIYSARNLYVANGRIVFLTMYDKSRKRRGNTEYVLRCLPDELSQIVAKYIIYIRPFSQTVQCRNQDYLFADERGPWAGEQLTRALAAATKAHLGVRLTVLGWRQVAIAIANEHLGRASKTWEQEEHEDEEEGFADGDDEAEVEMSVLQHVLVRQSAHGHRVAQRHYAIDGAFLNYLGPALTNAYMQASRAWHTFFQLKSEGVKAAEAAAGAVDGAAGGRATHRREASQQLQPDQVKRNGSAVETAAAAARDRAMEGLRRIYGPDAQPQSAEQAAALEFVHRPVHQTATAIIVLPTGSGKTVLFFSLAAMAVGQTVIVVVPFAALVDDIVARARGEGHGSGSGSLQCKEWTGEGSVAATPQLLVVSADRAVSGAFLHYAKGLQLHGQLAHVFFDECHVAFTDTSYRLRLRELWHLRYLDCPFTCLTATLIVRLENVLRDHLLLPQAELFRRSTMRRTIRYTVIDSKEQQLEDAGLALVDTLPLPPGKRGVVYVRSYAMGETVSDKLGCPFYKATADDKSELLQAWVEGEGGWIVATGALGTGINIGGVIYVLHLDRPYGLTSFMQQSGRGGRSGEVSDSFVLLPSSGSGQFPAPRQELANAYSVEAQDEEALTEYLESSSCRRAILAWHLDGCADATSCIATDSILCDCCKVLLELGEAKSAAEEGSGSGAETGAEAIHQALQAEARQDEELEQFHQLLHGHCIYCQLMRVEGEDESHCHRDCPYAVERNCDVAAYRQWRSRLRLAQQHQCFRCGLSQAVCTAIEEQRPCVYSHLMLPGLFFLHQVEQLLGICQEVGFQGGEGRLWQWLNELGEGTFGRWESNWMRVWRRVKEIYLEVKSMQD